MALNKKSYGQYFTSAIIAEFMVSLITHSKEAKILEPSCGKGIFLEQLTKHGFCQQVAYEIDQELIPDNPIVRCKSFISASTSENFDVVIGNPPYIRWRNLAPKLKKELEHDPLWNAYFHSHCDYLFIFILKSIIQLRQNGELIFICSDYWLSSSSAAILRSKMYELGYISDIYIFKEEPVFEGVSASIIIFKFVKSLNIPSTIKCHQFVGTHNELTLGELLNHQCFYTYEVEQFKLDKPWSIATPETQQSIYPLEQKCQHTVGDFFDIGNGMVSGLDKAFKLPDDIELNPIEQQHILKVFKAKDLAKFYNISTSSYIFFYKEQLTKTDFNKNYPNFAKQLAPHIEALNKRYNYGKELNHWEFAFLRNYNLFCRAQDKIIVPCKERITNKSYFRFTYAPKEVFALQDTTAIYQNDRCEESLEYALAYLNTDLIFNWVCSNGTVKGGVAEFCEKPLACIPYRKIDFSNPKEVEIHQKITGLMQELLKAHTPEKFKLIEKLFLELLD